MRGHASCSGTGCGFRGASKCRSSTSRKWGSTMTADEYYQSIKDVREQWREQQEQRCMYCLVLRGPFEVHEIERRSQATRSWGSPCNYLLLCNYCHGTTFAAMPHHRQLAVKLVSDPDEFDLQGWLAIKDPHCDAPLRVTLADVVKNLKIR